MFRPALRLQRPATSETPDLPQRFAIPATVEQVLLVASLFWALAANRLFFGAALKDRGLADPASWGFALALGVLLVALHFLLLALVSNRWTVKPLLAVLTVATAFATFFMKSYSVFLDPSMLRNVLRTDVHEARELFTWTLLPHLLIYAVLPLLLLWRVRVVQRPWRRAALVRLGALLLAAVAAVGALMAVFQPFSSLMRNHKEVRYLITPANYLWSLGAVVAADAKGAALPRQAIGTDARPGPSWAATATRPRLLVLVVGETARAANWGLNGYARQTTPELAQLPVIPFKDVTACGTNTEVSLPCMFAPVGRRDYDESRIRGSEGLLHVAARAGVAVHWRDNQSGCKGVCDGLPNDSVESLKLPGLCAEGRCLDEGLLQGLDQRLASAKGVQLLVLHQLGNHGPSYFRRYPAAFNRFTPACESDDLRLCSREQIVNAYDNALLYTDHVVARLIRQLQASAGQVDSAVIYASDHGESLGENNLFLHGIPHAIAPDVQTKVPMLMWFSPGFTQALGLDTACLQRRAAEPASHDHLFHTLLGLLDVRSSVQEPRWDLTQDCRSTPPSMVNSAPPAAATAAH
ncbi:phosphoethanolamine transferase [Sphaerotilus microaerophilus]|uniref:Phosphoethanolamine transferase n=1 Tax=Sphaerotilus microaerophilus TaxID=2914710 RepID=A0ABN6PTQ1_9BURK|nr:phosphoethanolamine--lipid A transferase [Sphaerotilus sp. FB-5]BDI07270.1 phosphoethanolamine transferase [Sphaerotilus sp. FB-5]